MSTSTASICHTLDALEEARALDPNAQVALGFLDALRAWAEETLPDEAARDAVNDHSAAEGALG